MRFLFLVAFQVLIPQLAWAQTKKPVDVPPDLADWTPRPATGKAEAWEKKKDPDWDETRFRVMNTGPAFNCTMRYPLGKDHQTVYKATVVKLGLKGDAGFVFDRCTLQVTAVWTGGYLNHSARRFGLLNTPTPAGPLTYAVPVSKVWGVGTAAPVGIDPPFTAPADPKNLKYRGHYLHGDQIVFAYEVGGRTVWHQVERIAMPNGEIGLRETQLVEPGAAINWRDPATRQTRMIPAQNTVTTELTRAFRGESKAPVQPIDWRRGGPRRWGAPLVTKLVRGSDTGPFAVDTLTIPYDNPFKALFFCTGLDFLPDGRIAVCTCHGDVWVVTVQEAAGTCSWQRYATGLYHPLGLKIVDGKVIVLERGQLTRLHDLNDDGEADFYENLCHDWHTGSGEHSYDTCLETDREGNFYFFKTGDTNLPHGGCLMRVSKTGAKAEVFATGFRHPIGMGMSPTGIITGADQEGNWMPATRIDEYKLGGFYGDMRGHHRPVAPMTYDGPLCWLPREVDNSAGGQVWVPAGHWGPLGGLPLHFSYGRCKPYVLLRQSTPKGTQGGVWDLGVLFLSGVCRGRFSADGHLYVCGLNGWQTAAQADGCLQRMRRTEQPLQVVHQFQAVPDGVRLTFARPLNRATAENPANYRAAAWNYKWSGDYGSKRYKPSDGQVGQDDWKVEGVSLSPDGKTVHVRLRDFQPVMQLQLAANLKGVDGKPVVGSVYLSVHDMGASRK